MPNVGPPPQTGNALLDRWAVQFWKSSLTSDVNARSTDPTTADIPDGTFAVWKNTTSGVVKLWANSGGTLKSVALT